MKHCVTPDENISYLSITSRKTEEPRVGGRGVFMSGDQ